METHSKFTEYCNLIFTMSIDAVERKVTYNTYISNLELIAKRMREEFYIEDKKETVASKSRKGFW